MLPTASCCVLNNGPGAWAFASLAERLAPVLGIDIADKPREYNYLLHVEDYSISECNRLFIPYQSIQWAGDKRSLVSRFKKFGVPTPTTFLGQVWPDVIDIVRMYPDQQWCLKYPIGCAGSGHRMLTLDSKEPKDWPRTFVVQEFIRQERPEVYRTYAAGGELFGWVVRRFPANKPVSPWVAHARGAQYETLDAIPPTAKEAARLALTATDLLDSFGCVDLMQRPTGEWVVLEVGTDGMFNHVDRDLNDPELETELFRRIADSFWARA